MTGCKDELYIFEEEKEGYNGQNIVTMDLPDILIQWAQCMLIKKITEIKALDNMTNNILFSVET